MTSLREPFRDTWSKERLVRLFNSIAQRAAKGIVEKYPNILGIFVDGSAGRGDPGPYSDVDIGVIVGGGKLPRQVRYFDNGVYVGIDFSRLKKSITDFDDPEDFYWARGVTSSAKILYDPKGILRTRMKRRLKLRTPPHIREEVLWKSYYNIIEYSGKLRNGWLQRDEYLVRYAARVIAGRVQAALIALNDLSPISENVVWHQVLASKKKPTHVSTDFPLAMGLKGTADTERVFGSALRLARETLRLVNHEIGSSARKRSFQLLLKQPLSDYGL